MAVAYVGTNKLNGKRYVGITKRWPLRRAEHERAARNGAQQIIYRAIRKYGLENFTWKLIEKDIPDKIALEREAYWVRILKPEYNMTLGGAGITGLKHKRSSRLKMSKAKKGKPNPGQAERNKTPQKRETMRQHGLRRWETLREQFRRGPAAMARAVRCLNDGSVYASASEAARQYEVAKSLIIELCRGKSGRKRKSAKGRRFQYLQPTVEEQTAYENRDDPAYIGMLEVSDVST